MSKSENEKSQPINHLEELRRFHASHKIMTILSQSKANIETLIDNLPDIFIIVDHEGEILKANHSLAQIYSCHIEDLLGINASTLFRKEDWQRFRDKIAVLGRSQLKTVQVELPVNDEALKKNYIINWRITKFQAHDKATSLYCVIGTDITELRVRQTQLKELSDNLADLVEEKTQDIALLLDTIEQGIFSIGIDMKVNGAHSKFAETIFQIQTFQDESLKDIFQLSDQEYKEFANWFELFKQPVRLKRWKKFVKLCPFFQRHLTINGQSKIVSIEYSPVIKQQKLSQLMILVSDITEKVRAEESIKKIEEENATKIDRILGIVNNKQISLALFFEETSEFIEFFTDINQEEELVMQAEELFRKTHTLKGNAGSFGFKVLAYICNELESLISSVISQDSNDINRIFNDWQSSLRSLIIEYGNLHRIRNKVFFNKKSMEILDTEYEQLLTDIKEHKISSNDEFYERVYQLNSYYFEEYCQKYSNLVKLYREQFNKNIADLQILNPNQLIHKNVMAILDSPITHIIRNAIDHGLEEDIRREALGKGPGQISIACHIEGDQVKVTIKDDGQGIDPEKVLKKAVSHKLVEAQDIPNFSEQEIIHLIFSSGLSTKNDVTTISGRGQGLGAAKQEIERYNGNIEVFSSPEKGCSFVISIPSRQSTL